MSDGDLTADDLAAGERMFASPVQFLLSAPSLEVLPAADRPEIAFAGRSNVGKSSLINALARQKQLARASNTPGRTQELNFFTPAGSDLFIVDMPGYGFAEAPKQKVEAWTALIKDYLRGRQTLVRVFLLVDSRHGIKEIDRTIMELLDTSAVTYQVVLTKADKITPAALDKLRSATALTLKKHTAAFPAVLATSSDEGSGISELRAVIAKLSVEHARR